MPESKIGDVTDFIEQVVNDLLVSLEEVGIQASEVLDTLENVISNLRQDLACDE